MRKRPVVLKAFVVFFLLVSVFMFSGAESAFCKDNFQAAPTHQCITCQAGHDVSVLSESVPVTPVVQKTFLQMERFQFYPQGAVAVFFRPPIFV
jgi:hypothetical protein